MTNWIYFSLSVVTICMAHLIRVYRGGLFIKVYEKPKYKSLIQSMSLGYALNYFIPYKLGELARAWVSGKKMKNGRALSFSTVIVDRYLDIVSVGVIFAGIYFSGLGDRASADSAVFYIGVAAVFLLGALIIYLLKKPVKRMLLFAAGIFNGNIEAKILRVSWSLIWNFKDIFLRLDKFRLMMTTIGMWGGYILSYYFYAEALNVSEKGTSWMDVFMMLFSQNGVKGSTGTATLVLDGDISGNALFMVLYMVLPLLVLFVFSMFLKDEGSDYAADEAYLNLFPHVDAEERLNFLENYFSDENREYYRNYLKINQNISIIRDYSAGSNATTMLCMDGNGSFFRKYAFGVDGDKLYDQILWIEENKDMLALPDIMRQEKTPVYCYYDMPYSPDAVGLFEYAHSMPVEYSWRIIEQVLRSLEQSIYKKDARPADRETIDEYIEQKVEKNVKKIRGAKGIRDLQQYDRICINGVYYNNLAFYKKYLSKDYLGKVFSTDTYSVIHGDMTIENIIALRNDEKDSGFYVIDPNTGNIHDSPNLDYGKLLQSVHGGYEFFMTVKDVSVKDDSVSFVLTKSSAYTELHARLRAYMEEHFSQERVRSIYFHEIVHWLRLMPYKISRGSRQSLLFYAGMLIVMDDVIRMYGDMRA